MYGYNNMYNRPIGVPTQPINNQFMQPTVQSVQPNMIGGLQGKTVDSIDVVKALDIPLDGSVSYFPLVDGSSIITKKLQSDGTTKTTIYKVTEEKEASLPKYVTIDDVKKEMENIDLSDLDDLKDEIREIKKDLKDLKKKKSDE